MKKIAFLGIFTGLVLLLSCDNDSNLDPIGEWNLTAPNILAPTDADLVLNESQPLQSFDFSWEPAVSSERYQVRYSLVLYKTAGSITDPVFTKVSDEAGKATSVSLSAAEVDLALSYAGYPAGENAELQWGVVASSLDKRTTDSQAITIRRFDTEYMPMALYLSGEGAETGDDLALSREMRHLTDADGAPTHVFEIYTWLSAGKPFKVFGGQELPTHVYGGSQGNLVKAGNGITVAEDGAYRLTVDLNAGTYNLLPIGRWSLVGDAVEGGWGGDVPLAYTGNGVWQSTVFLMPGNMVFRANGDWAYLLKRIEGTENELYMESQAGSAGVTIQDVPAAVTGNHVVTLDLSTVPYTYTIVPEDTGVQPPSATPDELYLLSNGNVIATFTKDGDLFSTGVYIPLQASVTYQLNSASDGSGTAYSLVDGIGNTTSPDSDAVVGASNFGETASDITVARDQAYLLNFNFETGSYNWKYYNLKLFHWDEVGGGWDSRNEYVMTYSHPLKFSVTGALKAGYHMKFNSPWDIQFGTDATTLTGTVTNGGPNMVVITSDGTYTAALEVSNDYQEATYEIVKQ